MWQVFDKLIKLLSFNPKFHILCLLCKSISDKYVKYCLIRLFMQFKFKQKKKKKKKGEKKKERKYVPANKLIQFNFIS